MQISDLCSPLLHNSKLNKTTHSSKLHTSDQTTDTKHSKLSHVYKSNTFIYDSLCFLLFSFLELLHLVLDDLVPHFLGLHHLEAIEVRHLCPLLPGLDLLGPAALLPLLTDLGLLPGAPHVLLTRAVRDFDDVVSELQALEGHGLPLDPSARAVHQRPVSVYGLQVKNEPTPNLLDIKKTCTWTCHEKTRNRFIVRPLAFSLSSFHSCFKIQHNDA